MTYSNLSRTTAAILFVLLLLSASSVWAAMGTVVLKSGDRFENVDYMVIKAYKIVQFEASGQKKSVSFADIQNIFDRDGADVTTKVLGGDYRKETAPPTAPTSPTTTDQPGQPGQPEQTWLEPEHEVYQRHSYRPWNMAVQTGANFTLPAGKYYDGISSGIGFGVDLVIPFSHNMSLRATVSKAGSKLEDSFMRQLILPGFTFVSDNSQIHIWRYLVSAQYQKPYGNEQFDKGYWFLYSGLGITNNSISGNAIVSEDATGDLYTLTIQPDKSRFTMTVGAGGVSMLSRWMGLQYAGSFDMIFVGTSSNSNGYETMQYAYNFDIRFGLVFHIGARNDRE